VSQARARQSTSQNRNVPSANSQNRQKNTERDHNRTAPYEMKRCPAPDWRNLGNMATHGFPKAIPEVPVSNVERVAEYYVNVFGFPFRLG
jgi:hypothetical protein